MPLDFDLYCSVSPDEMRALQRVVGAARELCVGFASNGAGDAPAGQGVHGLSRSRAEAELAESLLDLDAVRTHRNSRLDRPAGTLAPWLHEYLHCSAGRSSAWMPGEVEPRTGVASASERARAVT